MREIILCTFLVAVFFLQWLLPSPFDATSPKQIQWYARGTKIAVEGTVIKAPERRPTSTRYVLQVSKPASGRMLFDDRNQFPAYEHGDVLVVTGTLLRTIDAFDGSYARYLAVEDITTLMRYPKIEKIRDGDPGLLRALLRFRKICIERINRIFPEPQASLLAGLLTGERAGIPGHVLDDFRATGLTHVLAISGFNITLVVMLLSSLLFFLPLPWRVPPTTIAITLFTLMVGASASAVRAAIMGILGLVALATGRKRLAHLMILFTASIMLLWNPRQLWWDAGFQLSFLAVLGLTYIAPRLKPFIERLRLPPCIADPLLATSSAQIATLPWSVYVFGRIPLLSLPANLLIAPLIAPAMFFGTLGTALSVISLPLGQLASYPAWMLLRAMITVAHIFASVPFSSITISLPSI